MPETIDWGEKFRQLGKDVSDAITEPAQMRLKAAVMSREMDREDEKLLEERTKKANRAALASKFQDPTEKAFYEADDYDSYLKREELDLKRKELNIKAAKAARSGSGGGGGGGGDGGDLGDINKYFKKFNLANAYVKNWQSQMDAAQNKVIEASKSGNFEALSKAQDEVVALSNAGDKLKMVVRTFSTEGRTAAANEMEAMIDTGMQGMDTKKAHATEQVIDGKIKNSGELNPAVATELDNSTNEYGLGISLKGVPADADLDKYMVGLAHNDGVGMDKVKFIRNLTDHKIAAQMSNDDRLPMNVRKAAGAKYKRLVTFDALYGEEGKSKIRSLSDNEIINMSKVDKAKTVEERAKTAEAKKVLEERKEEGRFLSPSFKKMEEEARSGKSFMSR